MTTKNPLAWNPSNGVPFAGTHRQRAGYAKRKHQQQQQRRRQQQRSTIMPFKP